MGKVFGVEWKRSWRKNCPEEKAGGGRDITSFCKLLRLSQYVRRKQACSTVGINTRAFFFLICVKVRLRRNWIPHEFAYVPTIEQLNNILEICSVVWHCGALEGLDIFLKYPILLLSKKAILINIYPVLVFVFREFPHLLTFKFSIQLIYI